MNYNAESLLNVLTTTSKQKWRVDAACRTRGRQEWFYDYHLCDVNCEEDCLDKEESITKREYVARIEAAVRICKGTADGRVAPCPVREQCLAWALDNASQVGVAGGTTTFERKRIRATQRRHDKENPS